MRILLTNDDGYQSEGLLKLKDSLEQIAHVDVLAPDRNWSASSHSRTLRGSLTVRRTQLADGSTILTSDGTPSDCVALALMAVLPHRPDLVVSGINRGPNLGSDVTYSGTVAAAMEGVLFGLPAIAFSLGGYSDWYFDPAAAFAQWLIPEVLQKGLPDGVLLNVNVPNHRDGTIREVEWTRLGKLIYQNKLELVDQDEDWQHFHMAGIPPSGEIIPGTDIAALAAGRISITPLHLDLTEYRFLQELGRWGLDKVITL
jgi:5'-nucleotidase